MNALRRLWHRYRGCRPYHYQPEEITDGRVYGPWLYCPACGTTVQLLREPPFGHPDSMTVEFSEAVEEWLAELDEELFPEEAV